MGDGVMLFQETTYRHYKTIRLRPEKFTAYLTNNVGFSSYRMLTHTGSKSMHPQTKTCRRWTQVLMISQFVLTIFPLQLTTGQSTYSTKAMPRRRDPAGSRALMTKSEICFVTVFAKCKREQSAASGAYSELALDWLASMKWHHRELCNQSGFTVNVYATCKRASGLERLGDPKGTVFQNAIALFDCKINFLSTKYHWSQSVIFYLFSIKLLSQTIKLQSSVGKATFWYEPKKTCHWLLIMVYSIGKMVWVVSKGDIMICHSLEKPPQILLEIQRFSWHPDICFFLYVLC